MKKKIQHFLWRCINNSLPVLQNINTRGVHCSTICHNCGEAVETVEHVMLECPFARTVWRISPVRWDGIQEGDLFFKQWWLDLIKARNGHCLQERMEMSAFIFWHLWKARNDWHFNRVGSDPKVLIDRAVLEWSEFQEVVISKESRLVSTRIQQHQDEWSKPNAGYVRINFCSQVESSSRAVIGITAMNENGTITDAWSVSREGHFSPVAADLEAIRCALILAQQKGWRSIEVKLDVKAMALCLQGRSSPTVETLTLAEDIFLLALMFDDCIFGYENRKFNRSSAKLVDFARVNNTSLAWCGVFPDWLENAVQQEFRPVGHL